VVTRRPMRTVERKSPAATTRLARLSTTETQASWLRGELGATLATASREDRASRTGSHAETETVNLGATAIVRLESSLAHSCISDLIQLCM
jgi:hypothetical protein